MIVVVGGIKGGSGKTTVALHLAILCAQHDVLLIDADDQETATDFTILRNARRAGGAGYTSIKLTGPAVRTETHRLAAKYDHIIIDTGGRDTTSQRAALTVADVLLVPFLPRNRSRSQKILARLDIYRVRSPHGYERFVTTRDLGAHPT